MKRIAVIFFALSFVAFGFNSCTTYEEGPEFSLLPAEMRIKGSWVQEAMYINDQLQENTTFKLEFILQKDGSGTRYTKVESFTISDDIEWKLSDDKKTLLVKKPYSPIPSETEWDDFKILRLTTNELWLEKVTRTSGIWQLRYKKV
ncbi:MAG TPA: hypothetical protein PLC87_10625 [Bacteroidales bacterium]|nr:hypothetical protein [Bacteroidales bacterium]HOL98908.1 hypothetical protein [Bacteroidales bacterium]HUM33333.1 hypothetical protein [Bacteroidales bacterium]